MLKPNPDQLESLLEELDNFLVMNDLREQLAISLLDAGDFFTELHYLSAFYKHLQESVKPDASEAEREDNERRVYRFMQGGYYLTVEHVPVIGELIRRGLVLPRPIRTGGFIPRFRRPDQIILTLRGEWFAGIILGQPLQYTASISGREVSVGVPYQAVPSVWSGFEKGQIFRDSHPISRHPIQGDYTCSSCHNMSICERKKPPTVETLAGIPSCILIESP